jgi:hypothetical protein
VDVFHRVVQQAIAVCRFEEEGYKGPASYDDLLSYYNQRDHKFIDRHLIKDALNKLLLCSIEIQTNQSYQSYDEHYQALLRGLDPNSPTERKFHRLSLQSWTTSARCRSKKGAGSLCATGFLL